MPERVPLVSTDDDPALAWCHPPVAHMRWVDAVRKGKADRKIINFGAEFIPGGSIGPVWKG